MFFSQLTAKVCLLGSIPEKYIDECHQSSVPYIKRLTGHRLRTYKFPKHQRKIQIKNPEEN